MTLGSDPRQTALDRARGLAPGLSERSAEIANARRLPDDVMQMLAGAGLMQLSRPKKYGGREIGMDTVYEVSRELARGDGSTAWVYVVINSHDLLIGHFPDEVQEAYWESAIPHAGSSYVPFGKVTRTKGGYTLAGKWSFSSGVDFVGWVIVGGVVGMRESDPSIPDQRFFLVPRADFTVVDDWHVMGLSGTGSKSIVLDHVFVPDNRVLSNEAISNGDTPGSRVHDNPDFHAPMWSLLAFALPAPATGIAQGAYDALVQEFRGRMTRPDPIFHSKRPAVQLHLSEASALIRASDHLYLQAMRETFAHVRAGNSLSLEQRAANRRDTTHSIAMARRAAEILLGMSGARGLATDGVVQRAVRDIYASSVHPATNCDSAGLNFGSIALGGAPTEVYF